MYKGRAEEKGKKGHDAGAPLMIRKGKPDMKQPSGGTDGKSKA